MSASLLFSTIPFRGSEEIQTGGELFPDGSAVELVRSVTGEMALLYCNAAGVQIVPEVFCSAKKYIPIELGQMTEKVLLPRQMIAHGSTRELHAALMDVFEANALSENGSLLLAAFSMATWVPELLPTAPCLVLDGNRDACTQLMRRLSAVCRHALLLSQIDRGSFLKLPVEGLQPTLLALDVSPDKRTSYILQASSQRGLLTPSGNTVRDLFCCRAVYGTDVPFDEAVRVAVLPRKLIGVLPNQVLEEIAERLQPKLLHYRIQALRSAQQQKPQLLSSRVDIHALHPLATAIVDDDELQQDMVELLKDRTERWDDGRSNVCSMIIECCLAVCHEEKAQVQVHELTKLVNAALTGRGERLQLTDRKVGATLKSMALPTTDIKDVRGLELLEPTRRRIHQLALEYNVPTIRSCEVRCPLCQAFWGEQEQPPQVT